MQDFAESTVNYGDGQTNVNQPPQSVLQNGFIPQTATARGQPLAAQWLNWIIRTLFRYINRDRVSDANGVGLFNIPDSFIRLEATDKSDKTKHLVAIGYKGAAGSVHGLHVLQSSVLTLGTPNANGDQPVLGGANVIIYATSRQFGDL